jgi:NitT/TauT family transport system substrate-binding protein
LEKKLEKAGEKYAFLSPDALGIRFVANSVVTTREMVAKRPETVNRFLAALFQGWQDALDPNNEELSVKVLLDCDRETPERIVRKQLPVTRDLMKTSPVSDFGKLDVSAWKQTEQIMRTQGLIPGPVDVNALLWAGK